jgi:antitoxin (DNA-binding transcriptional repressor) of toxin-antitoxin stability system
MQQISSKEAASRLPELLGIVSAGEEVVIMNEKGEAFRIIPANTPIPKFGSAKGLVEMSEDFDEPLEDFADYMP